MKRRVQIHIEPKDKCAGAPDVLAQVLIALRRGHKQMVWGGDRAAPAPKDNNA